MLHPIETLSHLTYGTMVERLADYGDDLHWEDMEQWKDIDQVNDAFIEQGKGIGLTELGK